MSIEWNENMIKDILMAQPITVAIETIMTKSSPPFLQDQIAALDQSLLDDASAGMKDQLKAARSQLVKAQAKSTVHVQRRVLKVLAQLISDAGVDAAPLLNSSDKTRVHHDYDLVAAKLNKALPSDNSRGLSGSLLAKEAGVSYQVALKCLSRMQESGEIVRKGEGNQTLWHRA